MSVARGYFMTQKHQEKWVLITHAVLIPAFLDFGRLDPSVKASNCSPCSEQRTPPGTINSPQSINPPQKEAVEQLTLHLSPLEAKGSWFIGTRRGT